MLMSVQQIMPTDHVRMVVHVLTCLAAMCVRVHQSSLDRIVQTMLMSAWQVVTHHVRMVQCA